MNNLISIVVPVYNAEKYITRCISSLINQTYRNIEIILVEDGSTDNSAKICDEYADIDSRIRVIHQKNRGVGTARNIGIEAAKGDHIGFVDADDYVDVNMYNDMIATAIKNDADITVCKYQRFQGERCNPTQNLNKTEKEYRSQNILVNFIDAHDDISVVLWNKLYKTSLFEGIRCPENLICEDEAIIYKIIDRAKKIILINQIYYYYFYNSNSITTNNKYIYNMDIFQIYEERQKYYEQRGYTLLANLTKRTYLDRIMHRYKEITQNRNDVGAHDALEKLRNMYRTKYRTKDYKIKGNGYKLFFVSPPIYFLCRSIKFSVIKGKM